MEPFSPPCPFQLAGLLGQGTNSVTHPAGMQIFAANSLVLPRPVSSCGTSFLWPGLLQWTPHQPLANSPHYCQKHLLNKEIPLQCSAQNPSVAPTGLVLFGGSGPLLESQEHKGLLPWGKKMYILPAVYPHPQANTWTPQPALDSQLALASSGLTSYCLLFVPSCFGHIELFAVSLTLPAVSCFCAFRQLPLPGIPSPILATWQAPFFHILSCNIISSEVFPNTPGRHRHPHFLPLSENLQSSALLYCNCQFPQETVSSLKAGTGLSKSVASSAAWDLS